MAEKSRTSLSLRTDLLDYAEKVSDDYFQGNLSMFVGYLISCHKTGKINSIASYPEKINTPNDRTTESDSINIIDSNNFVKNGNISNKVSDEYTDTNSGCEFKDINVNTKQREDIICTSTNKSDISAVLGSIDNYFSSNKTVATI